MNYTLRSLKPVRSDVSRAKRWYKKQSLGLDGRFADAVIETLKSIQNRPESFGVRYKNVRRAQVKIFPYSIYFTVDVHARVITVVAVLHNKSDQQKMFDRT